MDHYAPDVLRDEMYFADGQILGEVYVYGSFLQSRMYKMNVKCNDCHNVHSLELKLQGNALCNQCHLKEKYDVYEHHFHKMNTEAAECINCHMTGRYYMVNDYRRDHSFRIPRPDLSVQYGTPNACNACHDDQTYQWSVDAVNTWYGEERPYHFSEILAFARTRDPASIPGLIRLADSIGESPMARATAIWYLGQHADPEATNAIARNLQDPEPFVRYTAANSLPQLSPQAKARVLTPLLTDPVRSVRIAAASAMADLKGSYMDEQVKSDYARASEEFMRGLSIRADFPGGQMEKAYYYDRLGQRDLAEIAYKKAIEIDNYYNRARINLANIYYASQRFDEAEALFKKVIEQEPEYGQAFYSLGLLLAEQNKMLEAAGYLEQAALLMPYSDRVHYNYGLVLQKLGKRAEAEKSFAQGLEANPGSTANLYALSFLYFEQKRYQEAYSTAQKLVNLNPREPSYQQLLSAIKNALNIRD
jgi:tetratricopeptide (TPR) repeat protein